MWIPREEWIKTLPRTIVASCVVMLDRDGRVLLLRYGPGRPAAGTGTAAATPWKAALSSTACSWP
ncbi:hypothetical protein OG851_05480 [Streptomyces sp. NBC_00161]|uniref:hypothetical protein n=1 Tax=Streptomyces sp. NBC_00161 TaxID=2975671 RepID=UPI003246A6B0